MVHARVRRRDAAVVEEVVPALLGVARAVRMALDRALDLEVHGVLVEAGHVAVVAVAVVVAVVVVAELARLAAVIVLIRGGVRPVVGDARPGNPGRVCDVLHHLLETVVRFKERFVLVLVRVGVVLGGGVLGPDALALRVRRPVGRHRVGFGFILRVLLGVEVDPGDVLGRGRPARIFAVRASPHHAASGKTQGATFRESPSLFVPNGAEISRRRTHRGST